MIKKLQRKFIMITMGSLFVVMLILIGSINAIYLYSMNDRLNNTIDFLADNNGKFPEDKKDMIPMGNHDDFLMNPEKKFQTRFFVVQLDEEGGILDTNTGHIAITSTDAQEFAKSVYSSNKSSGYYGVYKYSIINQDDGYMVIFLDCRDDLQKAKQLLIISSFVSVATLLIMFILLSVFSRRAIKPIIESTEKQKLFITDAGHEIKTPLAIISANADVLELMGGESEWITSIRNQTVRLDKLVKNLLTLAKMEEGNMKLTFTEFDLSETVYRMAGPFETVAATKNKKFFMDIKPDIKINADESSIDQLISTLVDNAMKYSDDEGTIKVTLTSSKKGAKLEVYNTTEEIDTNNLDRLFDRFYRADSSRSRDTGGYGIGLSIAKSIVEAHHGKITVKSEDGKSICFTVII